MIQASSAISVHGEIASENFPLEQPLVDCEQKVDSSVVHSCHLFFALRPELPLTVTFHGPGPQLTHDTHLSVFLWGWGAGRKARE